MTSGTKQYYWIEGAGSRKDFHWVTEEPFEYANWNSGEPNDVNQNEDCIHIYRSSGKWNDEHGDRANGSGIKETVGILCEWDGSHEQQICEIYLSNGDKVIIDKDPSLGDKSIDTDGDGIPDLDELILPQLPSLSLSLITPQVSHSQYFNGISAVAQLSKIPTEMGCLTVSKLPKVM